MTMAYGMELVEVNMIGEEDDATRGGQLAKVVPRPSGQP